MYLPSFGKARVANCHPTTFGSSHPSEGVLLGYRYPPEIRISVNYRRFLRDFGSVLGRQLLNTIIQLRLFYPILHQ